MPQRRLFVSDSFAVLQEAFVTAVQTIKTADPLLPLTILVPHAFLGAHLRRAVARAGHGHLGLYTYTLTDFAQMIAGSALTQEGWRPLSPQAAPLIMSKLLREEEPDNFFAPLAAHPHFPRDFLATITDLQQAEVQPGDLLAFCHQAQLSGTYRHKIESVFRLYDHYVRLLARQHFYDSSLLLERAAALLTVQQASSPLLLYGFYHLSPLQQRLLAAAWQARDVLVFFCWREGPAYEYATPTLTWFMSLGFHYTHLTGSQRHGSDLARVRTGLFADHPAARRSDVIDPDALPPPLSGAVATPQCDGSVTLISAPSKSREVREIGRTILALVRHHGLRFGDIAILLRDTTAYGPLIAETLTQLGIPCVLGSGLPLIQTHAGQSLLLLCRVLAEDYARARVMEFLAVAHPPWPQLLGEAASAPRDRWDVFSCEAGVVRGLTEWRERLPRLLHTLMPVDDDEGNATKSDDRRALQAFVMFMQDFLAACEQVPLHNTLQGWSEQTLRLFRTYVSPTPQTAEIEAELVRVGHLDLPDESISAQEWCRVVAMLLTFTRSSPLANGQGNARSMEGVWISDLRTAYGVPFRAVIIPGLVEGGFPQTARQDPVLLDAERQHLSESLLRQLPLRGRQDEEERLLLLFTLQSAEERVILTYPRLYHDSGRTALPSGYLLRIIETLGGRPASMADLEQWSVHVPSSPLDIGHPDTALDAIEFHLASAKQALATGKTTPLGYLAAASPFLARALHAAQQRWETPTVTPFDGMITDDTVKAQLWQRLLPPQATLSVHALETYARCPFRYFLQTVLDLTPREEPEQCTALSPRDRGALLHHILYDFFGRLRAAGQLPIATQDHAALTRLLLQVAAIHLSAFRRSRAVGFPLLWELEQERLYERLQLLLKREYEAGEHFLPTCLAVSFGTERRGEEHSFLPSGPVSFPLDTGEEVRLQGHIDRIDWSPHQQRARIWDYKTGKAVNGRFAGGTALQLPLALFAARKLRPDVVWESADYLYIDHLQKKAPAPFSNETWPETLVTLRTVVTTLVQSLRSGCFVSTPSSCHPCPFPLICAAHTEPYYTRKLADPRVHPLQAVKAIP